MKGQVKKLVESIIEKLVIERIKFLGCKSEICCQPSYTDRQTITREESAVRISYNPKLDTKRSDRK
jgi:hypothetical protein